MSIKRMILALAVLAVLVLAACQAPAASPASTDNGMTRNITSNGIGKIYLTPDVAYVFIGVQSQAENVADALNQNNSKAQAIAKKLVELGIEEKDIQTSNFNIFPQQQYSPEGTLTGTTYTVDNTVNVTVRDLTKLGSLLDGVVRAGANSINGINFDVLDKTQAISDARKLAVEDASRTAQELAAAAGLELGEVINLNSYTNSGPAPLYDAKGGGMMAANGQVPVSAGQMLISVDVNITYAIK